MKVRFILVLLAFAFPLSSVGAYKAYPGPKLPRDQIAIIETEVKLISRGFGFFDSILHIRIIVVDGNRVPKRLSVALKPGKHTLEVIRVTFGIIFEPRRTTGFATFTFEAQAGHTYFVHQRDGASLIIEDEQTKAVVARTRLITRREAVHVGDLNQVKQLILWGAKLKAKDKNGDTPLHWAAIMGRTKVAALLIHEGAKVNARNNNGDTPLHMAAYYG